VTVLQTCAPVQSYVGKKPAGRLVVSLVLGTAALFVLKADYPLLFVLCGCAFFSPCISCCVFPSSWSLTFGTRLGTLLVIVVSHCRQSLLSLIVAAQQPLPAGAGITEWAGRDLRAVFRTGVFRAVGFADPMSASLMCLFEAQQSVFARYSVGQESW
jgi:hypothetical protein